MTCKTAWQDRERLVAGWFGSVRNPLSGRGNVTDDGKRRLGDSVYRYAILESKLIGTGHAAIKRAKKTE